MLLFRGHLHICQRTALDLKEQDTYRVPVCTLTAIVWRALGDAFSSS